MKSAIVKRSIVLSGHKTSVSLEDAFWRGLKDIATTRRTTLSDLIGSIDAERQQGNLSSALRLFVLNHTLFSTLLRPQIVASDQPTADVAEGDYPVSVLGRQCVIHRTSNVEPLSTLL